MKHFWFRDVHEACAWARARGYWVDSTFVDCTAGGAFTVMLKTKPGGRVFQLTRWVVARETFKDFFR